MRGTKRLRGTTWELIVYDRRVKKNVSESLPARKGHPRSEREADSALAKLVARVEEGERAANATKKRFDAVVEDWLQKRQGSGKLSPTTFEQYEWIARTKLVPTFGKHRSDAITHTSIQALYNRLLQTYSERTIRHIHGVLRQILNYARRCGYRSDDPMEGVELPELPEPIESPDVDDVHRFIETARELGTDWEVLARLMAATGLRRGEVAALRWRDIDLKRGEVAVRHAVNGSALKRPKTEAGVRTLLIDGTTTKMLRQHRGWCDQRAIDYEVPVPTKDSFVFSREPDGDEPLHPSTITHRFQDIRARSGTSVRPHDMRRFSATHQSAAGVSVRDLMGRHGWKDVRTAMRYAGYLPARDRAIAELMGNVLDGRTASDDRQPG